MREQMSGSDLLVFTLKFLALKKVVFTCFRGQKKIQEHFLSQVYYATFQCRRYSVFKKSKKKI